MAFATKYKNGIVTIICYLYIMLFVYAAVSKLLDFENFRVQIAQSPLLTAYAGFIAYCVIIFEVGCALLLSISSRPLLGLYATYVLMLLFSNYIFLILNFSPYVPCSCGGILDDMGWTEHLIFNLVFVLLAALAILYFPKKIKNLKKVSLKLGGLTLSSIGLMFLLFITSETIVHHRNNFVRRIPPFAATKSHQKKLLYNSYYLAGADKENVYLGNTSAPSFVTVFDSALRNHKVHRIHLDDHGIPFSRIKIAVQPPHFFVSDGTVPCVFRGNVADWNAFPIIKGLQVFTHSVAVDSNSVLFRASTKKFGNVLGTLSATSNNNVSYKYNLLQKQKDGFFDTDGSMNYSEASRRFIYLYRYRNQYIVTDKYLNLIHRGNTIDTTTTANIQTKYISSKKQVKFSAPPQTVNRHSALHKNLLFVNSLLAGKYDPESMSKHASVIDVYNINNTSYMMSFYIYKEDGVAFDDFLVNDTHLFALFGKTLVVYRLHPFLTKEYKN